MMIQLLKFKYKKKVLWTPGKKNEGNKCIRNNV